jgi:hypothetical protein
MALYQLIFGTGSILRTSDGSIIPPDPANTDFANYLAWIDDGYVADPAAAVTPVDPAVASLKAQIAALTAQLAAMQTAPT